MSEKIRYYKGLSKVKVVTESEGYWIVEALEDFEDCSEGKGIIVKKGERRIARLIFYLKNKLYRQLLKSMNTNWTWRRN